MLLKNGSNSSSTSKCGLRKENIWGVSCKSEIQMWTEIRKGWLGVARGRAARPSAPHRSPRPQSHLAHTDQTLGEPKCTKKYQPTYILKAAVPGVQTPQTILNFPQKDCLRT